MTALRVDWPTPPGPLREAFAPWWVGASTAIWVVGVALLMLTDARLAAVLFVPSALAVAARLWLTSTRDRRPTEGWLLGGCAVWEPLAWATWSALVAVETTAWMLPVSVFGLWVSVESARPVFAGLFASWIVMGVVQALDLWWAFHLTRALHREQLDELERLAHRTWWPPRRRALEASCALLRGDLDGYVERAALPPERARVMLAERDGHGFDDPAGRPCPRDAAGLVFHVDGLLHHPFLAGDHEEVLARWSVIEPESWRLGRHARDGVAITVIASLCALGRLDEAHRLSRTLRRDLVDALWLAPCAPRTFAALTPLRVHPAGGGRDEEGSRTP